jgi:YidC/Oxa1 family membrane protein insertase
VSKNTVIAFLLIFITIWFFSTPSYYKFIYKTVFHTTYQEKSQKPPENKTEPDKNTAKSQPITPPVNKETKLAIMDTIKTVENQKALGDTIWVETDKMIIGINTLGAVIASIKMKDYTYDKATKKYIELVPDKDEGGSQLSIATESFDNQHFTYTGNKIDTVEKNDTASLVFTYSGVQGKVEKKYLFCNGNYVIALKVIKQGMKEQPITIGWKCGITESEKGKMSPSQMEYKKVHFMNDNYIEHIQMTKPGKEDKTGFYKWVGMTSKYFMIALVADTTLDADIQVQGEYAKNDSSSKKNQQLINYSIVYKSTAIDDTGKFWFYAGPTKYDELNRYKLKFDQVLFPVLGWPKVFFWADKWFPPVAEFVLWLLLALFKLVKDYGVAIVLLTILSKIVTYPLTQSSMKSMNRMKDIQPKVNAIRQKHKNNPKRMNEEIMALYKEEGINPLNPGCLPIFLQMPVFIALFVVLRKAIELRGAGTVLIPWIHDLSQPEIIFSLSGIIPGGIPLYGSNVAVLPIIMAILTFIQNKMTIKDPNQKAMIYMMPPIMLFLFNNFASGLVLYWTFQSALGLVQQYYTNKTSTISTQGITKTVLPAQGMKKTGKRK